MPASGLPKVRYRTRKWREYDPGPDRARRPPVWISPDLAWHAAEDTGRRCRPPVFTDAAIQAVLTLKVLCQLPLRAAQGMAGSLIRLTGLDWQVPHHSTVSRRQKSLTITIPDRARGGPLHLVVDSTGLKLLGEGEWKVRRHGADKQRVWRKAHLVIDGDSREGRAVEVRDHRHGDGEIVPGLLAQVPKAERIGVISGDGAHDTRGANEASASREAALVVPPRRNGRPWTGRTTGAEERNESLRAIGHLGRRLWKRWSANVAAGGEAAPRLQ